MKIFISILFTIINSIAFAESRYQYISPKPGSEMVTINHNIVIRPGMVLDPSSVSSDRFSIRGSKSGDHSFTIVISTDGKTIILTPLVPYAYSEEVSVMISDNLKAKDGSAIERMEYTFQTHRAYTDAENENFKRERPMMFNNYMENYNIGNSGDEDTRDIEGMFEITVNTNPAPGHIFFDAFSGYGSPSEYTGYSIISNDGDSLFHRETGFVDDFKLLRNGLFGVYKGSYECYNVLDSNFNAIDRIFPANGYGMDNHELQMLPDGHYFIIAQEFQVIDMTVYDPTYYPNASVFGTVIQEFDENKNLVFEWRAFDHVEIIEALHENLASGYIDYMHTNALEIDNDGHILASHRHLDQITKIDRNTGEFIWRLGGVENEFTFLNGSPTFSYQHDIRRINNGNITLFDNGNWNPEVYSSAREYYLDEEAKTADLVWSYSYPDDDGGFLFYGAMGSVQRLPDGNTFINWGWRGPVQNPSMSEVTPTGEIVWELRLAGAGNMVSYRSHKYEYDPCVRPTFERMREVDVTSDMATLEWPSAWNAVKYKLQYSEKGSDIWQQQIVEGGQTSQTLTNLTPNSVYYWRLQTFCDQAETTLSPFTQIKKFETLPLKPMTSEVYESIVIYPNPVSDILNVKYSGTSLTELRLVNMIGQELISTSLDGEEQNQIATLSLVNLPAGNYILELIGMEGKEVRKVFVE
ncbi:MAG: aryl-sulfate sulfotransferase [Chitinophagales bacterium]|nr:aryl-sulfate sulfotransferase [Chitinophagales bacterium]